MVENNAEHLLEKAFGERPNLHNWLQLSLRSTPAVLPYIQELTSFVLELKKNRTVDANDATRASKKRKLDLDGPHANGSRGSWLDPSVAAAVTIPDVGFQMPQRKKMKLEWLDYSAPSPKTGGIRAVSAGGEVEFGLPWQSIDEVFCLPVPEKAKPSWNFIVMPSSPDSEPILWNTPEPNKKEIEAGTASVQPQTTIDLINQQLSRLNPPRHVVQPDYEEFCSRDDKSYKKGEKRAWVKAWRGTKDGYLFFLPQGVLFCFKKPLLFIPLHSIESISYTSVVQITFNLVVSYCLPGKTQPEEVEFGMIDQNDHTPIDAYVRKHSLQDSSMAAERRAKRLNINPPEPADAPTNAEGGADVGEHEEDGETELQRAERMLQDAEDEEEEDYDPGAEGDSDDSDASDAESGSEIEEVQGEEMEEENDEDEDEEG